MTTKIIYLEYKSTPITVTVEAFTQICQLIDENHACHVCEEIFTPDNPCVSLNQCLHCYLARHSGLTSIGLAHEGEYHNDYAFLDERGYVFTSYAGSDEAQPRRSDYQTLIKWGFSVPATYTHKGEEKKLTESYWRVYGDFVHNEVVVAHYQASYQSTEVAYLVYKDGSIVELNKRSKENKELYKRAATLAESYKDENGFYAIGGYTSSHVTDAVVYSIISDLATTEYRAKQHEEKQARVNELVHDWLKGSVADTALVEIIDLYNQLGDPRNAARFQMFLKQEPASVVNDQNT